MLCGKKTPVWHCKNALKDDHTCEFLFCHTCKDSKMEEMGDHRPKRAKSGQTKDYDDNQNDEKCCDHNIMRLEICDEGTYFEESYIQKKWTTVSVTMPQNVWNVVLQFVIKFLCNLILKLGAMSNNCITPLNT